MKLLLDTNSLYWWLTDPLRLAEERFAEIPIESAHAVRAGQLPLHHRDPFDRMLVAQAHATGWPVVSADRIFEVYGVRRIW